MQRGTVIALTIGVAAVAAAVVRAGAGAVAQALESLRLSGLLVLALLHLPIVVLMGFAWRLASGDDPPASASRFVWARFVRDAAGEVLPFLYLGGVVFGVRALGRGRTITLGAVSACIDGAMELAAKLPYVLAALLTLLALGPQTRFTRLLFLAFTATCVVVASLAVARRSLGASLGAMARAVSARWPAVLSLDDGDAGRDLQACFDRILRQRMRLWSGFALHLCCWCLGAGEAWVIFRLLGVDLTLSQALAIDGTVVGLRTFGFMVPAAAGVQEVSYMLAAAVFGIPPAAAIAASFARRARDLVLGVGTLGIAVVGDASSALLRLRY
ncbi:MAG TPA: lysylphosphatidylglycerol synthase domain-containing protein [Solirubrobacteraceae bacterium]|nr:lysylphosphatidylglycerol synthase domain-containing protein [Solirubrobacteraceae bacterium]